MDWMQKGIYKKVKALRVKEMLFKKEGCSTSVRQHLILYLVDFWL